MDWMSQLRADDVSKLQDNLILNGDIFKLFRILLSLTVDMPRHSVLQNAAMPTPEEKAAFTKRLEIALRRSPEPVNGATELALRFNLRHKGTAISPQTAHKWLSGRAIPTNDKLATLAGWLNVDEHWLHYGPPPSKSSQQTKEAKSKASGKPTSETITLASKIQNLAPHRRYLLEELVEQLQNDVG